MFKTYTIYEAYKHIKNIWDEHSSQIPDIIYWNPIIYTESGITEQIDALLAKSQHLGIIHFADPRHPDNVPGIWLHSSILVRLSDEDNGI